MIVRDNGDAWQIVLQTDHADLSAQFVDSWGNGGGFVRPSPFPSVRTVADRHDDGWAIWEQAPMIDGESRKPVTFLDVNVLVHLAFYRAGIAAVGEEDPYAGLLLSMHGAGIYRRRYGTQESLRLMFQDEVKEEVDAFVQEQEESYPKRMAEIGVADEERWVNYRLLQVFDRLSLYFCMRDLEGGEADTLSPVPLDYEGKEAELALEPLAPWHVRASPYPFAESPARFTLLRRVLPKRDWTLDEFRQEFFASEPVRTEITIER